VLRRSLVLWLLLLPLVVVVLFPYAVMLFTALKPRVEVFSYPPSWLPTRFAWENFAAMYEALGFGSALLTSLTIAVLATLLVLAVSVPAAYALARFEFRGKGAYQQYLLVTQMLSPIVLVVGIFRTMVQFGLLDTMLALVLVYGAFNVAFSTWMLYRYFEALPRELEEAALVDGASRLQSVRYIFLPLALPAVAVAAMFTFIWVWNEFVLALTLLRSAENYTLTLAVYAAVGGRYTVEWQQVMAAALATTLPAVALFLYLQGHLQRGLLLGSSR
jgi:multiple sugar transport system permease protein